MPGHFEQFPHAVILDNASNFKQANVIATIAIIFIVLSKSTEPNHASQLVAHAEKNFRVLLLLIIYQALTFINAVALNMRSISNARVTKDRSHSIKICCCNFS